MKGGRRGKERGKEGEKKERGKKQGSFWAYGTATRWKSKFISEKGRFFNVHFSPIPSRNCLRFVFLLSKSARSAPAASPPHGPYQALRGGGAVLPAASPRKVRTVPKGRFPAFWYRTFAGAWLNINCLGQLPGPPDKCCPVLAEHQNMSYGGTDAATR